MLTLKRAKMIYFGKPKKKARLSSPDCHGNNLKSWWNVTASSHGAIFSGSSKSRAFCFSLFPVPITSCLLCCRGERCQTRWCVMPCGSLNKRLDMHCERCLMKTFDHRGTLVSGQPVDACCQEVNGIPPSSRDTRSGGSYINIASWPPPWPLEHLMSPLCVFAIRATWLQRAVYVTGVICREIDEQTLRQSDIFYVWQLCSLSAAVTHSGGPVLI